MDLRKFFSQSPTFAPDATRLSNDGISLGNSFANPPPNALNKSNTIPKTDLMPPILRRIPANIGQSLSYLFSLHSQFKKFCDTVSIFLDSAASFSPMLLGSMLKRACFTSPSTTLRELKEFATALMMLSLPPRSFQVCSTSLRVLVCFSSTSLMALLMPVKSLVASSMLPNTISHVCPQPDCAASFSVSHILDSVRTCVAASIAFWPSSVVVSLYLLSVLMMTSRVPHWY